MYKEITKCRISDSKNLINVLSLGNQYLTGVFPKTKNEKVTIGPVDLVWCPDSGLLQMKQSYSLDEMYGDNYGYRSGLNASMVKHLQKKIKTLCILQLVYAINFTKYVSVHIDSHVLSCLYTDTCTSIPVYIHLYRYTSIGIHVYLYIHRDTHTVCRDTHTQV